jgi:hypothetical protein
MQTQYDELYHVIDMQMTPLVHIGGPFGLVLLHRIHSRLGMIPNMGQKNYSKYFAYHSKGNTHSVEPTMV